MWLLTKVGFFSVVQKAADQDSDSLTVRGRVKQDLEALRREYLPSAGEILEHVATDYPYRMRVPRTDFASALSSLALDIDYSNFKNEIAQRQGRGRAHVYGVVWSILNDLEDGTD